jgi:hypothetical protein
MTKYTAAFLLMLSIGSCAQSQKVPEYETVNVTILKIERIREDSEGTLWYTNKLTMRDSRGIIYNASARCILVPLPTPDSVISCGHLVMPRIAETYPAKITFGGTLIYFGEILTGTQGFEIESEEVYGRLEGK